MSLEERVDHTQISLPKVVFYKRVGLFKRRTVYLKGFKNGVPVATDNLEEARVYEGLHAIYNMQDILLFTRWKAS